MDDVDIDGQVSYMEEHIQILDCREHVLLNKVIPLVKVMWRYHRVDEFTWKSEDEMMNVHSHLF